MAGGARHIREIFGAVVVGSTSKACVDVAGGTVWSGAADSGIVG